MIVYKQGDILKDDAEAVVIPVNCLGIAGGGLAYQAKKKWPFWYDAYRFWCLASDEKMKPGGIVCTRLNYEKVIFSFFTKGDWRKPSQIEWVESGLIELSKHPTFLRMKSIAVPALGCGLGELDWSRVEPLIQKHLGEMPCEVRVYPPKGKKR